jgi:hypothetical protein
MDTWRGGALFRSDKVEMLNMFVFLVAPIFTLTVCLMVQYDEAWRMSAGVWCALVLITFCVWSLAVTIREVKSCFWLIEKLYYSPPAEGGEVNKWKKLMTIAKLAFLKSQISWYSGTRKERYHVAGTDIVDNDYEKGFCSSEDYKPVETTSSLYSRLTALSCCSARLKMFDTLVPPKRVWKSSELLETPSIVTKNNWFMQRMWCGGADRQTKVVVANGPYALTPDQIKYSGLCTILSSTLTLLLIGFLVWMEQGAGIYLIVGVLAVVCIIYPLGKQSYELHKMYESVNTNDQQLFYSRRSINQETGTTLFQVWETVR